MLSIVIPTLNEEKNISKTLNKLKRLSNQIDLDVIVVDDNSSDNTLNIVKSFNSNFKIKIIENKINLGLGYALIKGYDFSKNQFAMFLDADLSVNESDILKLYKSRIKNGMVIGSRYINGSKIVGADKKKVFVSRFLNFFISKIFKLKIVDISHSFRIISKNINLSYNNFSHPGFFWEITINAKRNNFFLKEIPITFEDRKYGVSKNKSYLMLLSVLKSLTYLAK